ncbi:DUF1648 domain-containing protein [Aureivirga marina]|uniref:DUF1648 domain-containing protein n=1 Tax=Aureivirga marina TaxID=1182451 RepID=UPI0018CBE978|nr:DUF1648 domain-containing protein [Aureivirga marina]
MNQRPKIKIEPSLFDKITIFTTWSIFILIVVYTFHTFSELPNTIPTHFDEKGEINGFSSKNTLWNLTGLIFIINVGFLILAKFPHKFNYIVKITEENAKRQYTLAIRLLFVTAFLTTVLLSFINYRIIQIGLNANQGNIGKAFLPIILISVVIYVSVTTYLIFKNK